MVELHFVGITHRIYGCRFVVDQQGNDLVLGGMKAHEDSLSQGHFVKRTCSLTVPSVFLFILANVHGEMFLSSFVAGVPAK